MNNITMARRHIKHPTNQRGFVLPVGMIMLAVMTVIGISAMRDSNMQERMASNYLDKEKSFQAAESALRVIQRASLRTSYENIAASADFVSLSDNPSAARDLSQADWYNSSNPVGWVVTAVVDSTDNKLYRDPRAVIEELENTDSLKVGKEKANEELAKRFYRVTTHANGETDTARTTLQGVIVQE
ncbi:MAG: hypothetical protein KTR18_14765 [Acidiferrobacterales bacterium]|nr:hypothetical protein [Acidiferrobacterales bacterium]